MKIGQVAMVGVRAHNEELTEAKLRDDRPSDPPPTT